MFGLGKRKQHEELPQLETLELTDLDDMPVIIKIADIISVHRHQGITMVNVYNKIIGRYFYYKVKQTPLQIAPLIKSIKV